MVAPDSMETFIPAPSPPPIAGVLFLAMSFFLFLPVIILAPAKFAMTFSIGSGALGSPLETAAASHLCRRSMCHVCLPSTLRSVPLTHLPTWPPPRLPARHAALVIASLGALRGWRTMFGHLLSKDRLPFTAGALCVCVCECAWRAWSYV